MKIAEMKSGLNGITLLIRSMIEKEARNGKPYLFITFSDGVEEISANMFDVTKETVGFAVSDLVDATIEKGEYAGAASYIVKQLVASKDDVMNYILTSPVKPEKAYEVLIGLAKKIKNANLKKAVIAIYEAYKSKLLWSAGAMTVHHSEVGGLLYHVYRMAFSAEAMQVFYDSVLNPDIVMAGILLHDIGKLKELSTDAVGNVTWNKEGSLFGHLLIGYQIADFFFKKYKVDPSIAEHVEHIIVSHHYKPEWGAVVQPATPEAFYVSQIDFIDSRMYMYEKEIVKLEPGELSGGRIKYLDNIKLYRPALPVEEEKKKEGES